MAIRNRAHDLYLKGLTYAEIGKEMGVSRQRAQQLVKPPTPVMDFIRKRAGGACEQCKIALANGHVHHMSNDAGFNDIDNLQYLCISCHQTKHYNEAFPANTLGLAMAARRLGLSRCRMDQLARSGAIAVQTDPATGWRHITETEFQRFEALRRKPGRPWNKSIQDEK